MYRYCFKLVNEKDAMKVLGLYDNSGPKYHRILLPLCLMDGVEFKIVNSITEDLVKDIDVLFFNRLIPSMVPGALIEIILRWKEQYGFSMVCDFDDHWELGQDHLLYQAYKEHGLPAIMERWIKESDAVFVTHERLYHEVFPINQSCYILPNAIPGVGQFIYPKQEDPLTRLFWAGGVTHKNDIKILQRPLQLIKRDKVKFILGGYIKGNSEWEAMAKMFTTNSAYNTEVLEALRVNDYYAMYSKCDIALIPLLETKFNSYKSNLKILEAANVSAPVIVSRVHPYLGFPEDLVNYVDSRNTWFSQITKLLSSPGQARYQGRQLQKYCSEHFNFNRINDQRKQIFYDLRKQKLAGEVPTLSYQQGVQ